METKKLSESELAEIKLLRDKINKKIFEFGNLSIEKMEIDKHVQSFLEKDKKLREEWVGLEKMEREFVDKLISRYGEGDLDLENGTYRPVKNS